MFLYDYFQGTRGDHTISTDAVDFVNDSVKLALLDDTHIPSQSTHSYWDDVSADEMVGTGYTSGGNLLSGKSVTFVSEVTRWLSDDVTWTTDLVNFRYAVLYKDTGTPSTSILITLYDFGDSKSSTTADPLIARYALGYLSLTE